MKHNLHHTVIIGGGFGGLTAARALGGMNGDVTLIDKRNFHLFQPLLYQAATGLLCPSEITSPLRHVLRRQKDATVLLGEVADIDPAAKRVILTDGEVSYDSLIVAAGMRNHYFGNDEWAKHAPGLKTVEDSADIRQKVFMAFEIAEREADPELREQWLTFAVIGAGATGIELSGMLAEIARHTLKGEFRSIRAETARIMLIDGADRILPGFPEELSDRAEESLGRLGVTTMVKTRLVDIEESGIRIEHEGTEEFIPARTVLWATGVRAAELGERLAARTGSRTDRQGRIFVGGDLTIEGHPEIFVIGDMAHFETETGEILPGLAPVATQQGRYAARTIRNRLAGKSSAGPFRYFDKGVLAVIGRNAAVGTIGTWRFGGRFAWLLWLFVHLALLIHYENKLIVLFRWAFQYINHSHGARHISLDEEKLELPITRDRGSG
jgi:NADH dehydrogenase